MKYQKESNGVELDSDAMKFTGCKPGGQWAFIAFLQCSSNSSHFSSTSSFSAAS